MLPNGLVLSCSFDKMVIAWSYLVEQEVRRWEKNEQLRCMDFIDTPKLQKLFVGTDRGVILAIDIQELLELDNLVDDYSVAKREFEGDRFKGLNPDDFSLEELQDFEKLQKLDASG